VERVSTVWDGRGSTENRPQKTRGKRGKKEVYHGSQKKRRPEEERNGGSKLASKRTKRERGGNKRKETIRKSAAP